MKKKPKPIKEKEVMVQLSAGVWLHGIKVKQGDMVQFNPLRLIMDLDGGDEKIYTVDEFIEKEEE